MMSGSSESSKQKKFVNIIINMPTYKYIAQWYILKIKKDFLEVSQHFDSIKQFAKKTNMMKN